MADPDAAFAALADPRRRRILALVADGPVAAGQIAAAFDDVTQQAVSLHLRVLRDSGLVEVEPQGRHRLYRLRPERLGEVRAALDALWPERLERLKAAVEDEVRGG